MKNDKSFEEELQAEREKFLSLPPEEREKRVAQILDSYLRYLVRSRRYMRSEKGREVSRRASRKYRAKLREAYRQWLAQQSLMKGEEASVRKGG